MGSRIYVASIYSTGELQKVVVKHNCGKTFDVFMPNMKDILQPSKLFKF
jgi:hypothetical protein